MTNHVTRHEVHVELHGLTSFLTWLHGLSSLATLSSVYYPPSLGASFLLKGRSIIQRQKQLCKNNSNWYDPLDDDTAQEWRMWRNNLMYLDGKSITRCLK